MEKGTGRYVCLKRIVVKCIIGVPTDILRQFLYKNVPVQYCWGVILSRMPFFSRGKMELSFSFKAVLVIFFVVTQKTGQNLFVHGKNVTTLTSCGQTYCETSKNYPKIDLSILEASVSGRRGSTKSSAFDDDVPKAKSATLDDGYYSPPIGGANPGFYSVSHTLAGSGLPPWSMTQVGLQICPLVLEHIHPQEAINVRGQQRFIVNIGRLQQTVQLERCAPATESQPCNFVGTPQGVYSRCEQRYSIQRLATLIVDEESGRIETGTDQFQFPTSCSCRLVPGSFPPPPLPIAPYSPVPPPPPAVLPVVTSSSSLYPPPPLYYSDDNRIDRHAYARSLSPTTSTSSRGTFEPPFTTSQLTPQLRTISWQDKSLAPRSPERFDPSNP